MKNRRLRWRKFVDQDPKYYLNIEKAKFVTLKGREIRTSLHVPGEKVYLAVFLSLHDHAEAKSWESMPSITHKFTFMAARNSCWILVDVDKDQWIYIFKKRIVNWPKRFAFTLHDRDKLYKDMSKHVEQFTDAD